MGDRNELREEVIRGVGVVFGIWFVFMVAAYLIPVPDIEKWFWGITGITVALGLGASAYYFMITTILKISELSKLKSEKRWWDRREHRRKEALQRGEVEDEVH